MTETSVLLKKIANPMIIVRFATLDPKTLPTDKPPSPPNAAIVETESSGKDVATDNKMKPAAISDKPKALDNTETYLMILSLTTAIKNRDAMSIRRLYNIIHYTSLRVFCGDLISFAWTP